MSYIPLGLVNDVLLRLPVKSLLRFRSVEKSWRELIDDPDFIKMHMERSMKMEMGDSVQVIHRCNLKKFYSLRLDLSGNPIRDPEELQHPFGNRYDLDKSVAYNGDYEIHLVGSCNGLLCFFDSAHRIVLWNIATRKYFELQHLGIELPKFANLHHFVNYGFGYDSSTDDYKVVRLITAYNQSVSECSLVELYSLKSDSWTRYEDLVGYALESNYGILIGGALHWLRYESEMDDFENPIVGFDLAKEEFNFVPGPNCNLPGKFSLMNLGNYQGCLSLFCQFDNLASEMWVMTELGIKESWSPIFIVNLTYIYMRAIDHSNGKNIIVCEKNKESLEWYNIETNTLKTIKLCCETRSLEATFVHYESLFGTSWN
ncbi:F-box protein CPR30 [Abeliophyllum distichum]|uniref:F-box protein CPR30 n=1 Tax=Abeliophyllum distichum TaxID=126358 RepID=A0ABD1SZD1_9LAMI